MLAQIRQPLLLLPLLLKMLLPLLCSSEIYAEFFEPTAMTSSKHSELHPKSYEFCDEIYSNEEYEEDDYEDYKMRQISIDPMSLNHPPPAVLLPFINPKFISSSLPSSATSPPLNFKKQIIQKQNYHPAFHSSLIRQHSVTHLNNKGMFLSRSKSCGDGRSSEPSAEFDILSSSRRDKRGALISKGSSNRPNKVNYPQFTEDEEEFKCGAMCLLLLPGLAKKKHEQAQLRRRKANQEVRESDDDNANVEKFECGSWSSAIMLDDDDEESDVSPYFDLPLELIRGSGEDPHFPVKTAFVFDSEPKGVLKKNMRKSHESNRHVRFSTSAPTSYPASPSSGCITPRVFQARAEFNALIEAENAYINF